MGFLHISDETEIIIKENALKNNIEPGEEIERGYNGFSNCEKRLKEQKQYYDNREKIIYRWIEETSEKVFGQRLKPEEADIFRLKEPEK